MNEYSFKSKTRRCAIKKRGRKKSPEKRRNITQAAITVFSRVGYHKARIKDIAKISGVAEGTIYIYFKNKEDLLISIFKEKTRETIEFFKSEVQKEATPLDKLKRLISLHLETFEKEKDLARLYQLELRQSVRLTKEYFKVEHKEYLDLMGEIIKEGKEQGVFRKDINESIVKRVIFGAVDEVITTWVVSSKEYDLTSVYEPLTDVLLKGLLNPEK